MNNIVRLLLLLASAAGFSATTQAGVVIDGTRFVYGQGQSSIGVSVRNKSLAPYLINTKITPGGTWPGAVKPAQAEAFFVATPPLFLLQPQRENIIRVIQANGELPGDRESLFTLNIAAIPSGKAEAGSVQLAVRSALKLFWRPAGLKGDPQKAYRQLRWRQSDDALEVTNPGPYYVTLFQLNVAGKSVANAGVVAPFSQRRLDACPHTAHCQVRWQTINDYGRVMPPVVVLLPSTIK